MDVIDIGIIFVIIIGILIGLKRGFTKQIVSSLGVIVSIILAFIFKNKISVLLYCNFPFFSFGGILKGATILNILVYELISFLIIFAVLMMIFRILSILTTFLESALTATFVFGIPSKILGAILGAVEGYILAFVLLFVLTLPVFSFNDYIMKHSKFADNMLLDTPILSSYTKDTIDIVSEFADLKEQYKKSENDMQFNRNTLILFLKYKIVTVESIDTLVEKDKLKIDAIEEILRCYREETKNLCES